LQTPPVQISTALVKLQITPQPPQFVVVLISVSHPSIKLLQSANPELQLEISQTPLLHVGLLLLNEHTLSHLPQLLSDDVMLISHPSTT